MPTIILPSKVDEFDSSKSVSATQSHEDCYEGADLASFLQSISCEIKRSRLLDGNSLPEKIWFKKQFSIGVNDVTRVLERMTPNSDSEASFLRAHTINVKYKAPVVQLQAILLAADCHPRWLIKHLWSLALSRKVPLILVKDNKRGSLRLGELVKLKTSIAIGVKANGSTINQFFDKKLGRNHVPSDILISTKKHGLQNEPTLS